MVSSQQYGQRKEVETVSGPGFSPEMNLWYHKQSLSYVLLLGCVKVEFCV